MATDWKSLGVTGGVGVIAAVAGVYGSSMTSDRNEQIEQTKYEQRLGEKVGALEGERDALRETVRNLQAKLDKFSDALDGLQDEVKDTRRVVADPQKAAAIEALAVKIEGLEAELKAVQSQKAAPLDPAQVAAILARDYQAELRGVSGPAGPRGAQGDIGPQGDVGPKGDVGPVGPTGARGPQGPAGATGAQGAAGIAAAGSVSAIDEDALRAMVSEMIATVPSTGGAASETTAPAQQKVVKKNTCYEVSNINAAIGVFFEWGSYICIDNNPVLLLKGRYNARGFNFAYAGKNVDRIAVGNSLALNADNTKFFTSTEMDDEKGGIFGGIGSR